MRTSTPSCCASRCRSSCCGSGGGGGASRATAKASRSASASTRARGPRRWSGCTRFRSAKRAPPRRWCARCRHALPDHAILMTGTTAAGRETIKQVYGESVIATFLPYDYPESVQSLPRALPAAPRHPDGDRDLAEPARALRDARRAGGARQRAHVGEIGARLPALARADARRRSAAWRRCARRAKPTPRACATLGAPRVEVTGNLKFDVTLDAGAARRGARVESEGRAAGAAPRQHARGRRKTAFERTASDESVPDGGRASPSAALRRSGAICAVAAHAAAGCPIRATASISATRWARWRSITPPATWR